MMIVGWRNLRRVSGWGSNLILSRHASDPNCFNTLQGAINAKRKPIARKVKLRSMTAGPEARAEERGWSAAASTGAT